MKMFTIFSQHTRFAKLNIPFYRIHTAGNVRLLTATESAVLYIPSTVIVLVRKPFNKQQFAAHFIFTLVHDLHQLNMVFSMDICRCCSNNSKEQTPLFAQISSFEEDIKIDEQFTYADAIYLTTHIRYDEDDELPQTICNDCLDELISSINFRIKCEMNERALHKEADIPYDEPVIGEIIDKETFLGMHEIKLEDLDELAEEEQQQNESIQTLDYSNSDIKLEPNNDKSNENEPRFCEEYKCAECSKEFNSEVEFEKHCEYHRETTIERFVFVQFWEKIPNFLLNFLKQMNFSF